MHMGIAIVIVNVISRSCFKKNITFKSIFKLLNFKTYYIVEYLLDYLR